MKLPAGHPLSVQAERLFRENGVKTAMVEQGADLPLRKTKSLGGEGYRLTVTLDSISIDCGAANGGLHALQSLMQSIVKDGGGAPALAALEVRDQPRFSWARAS